VSLRFPKPKPKLLYQREVKAGVATLDKQERAKVRQRSGGRCEVRIDPPFMFLAPLRCDRRASENHHLLGGIGRRNRGRSILAEHRLDVCVTCHREITGHVLVPCVNKEQAECADTVRYERITK
jgi:hypothetical protein